MFPAPIAEITGTPASFAAMTISIFAVHIPQKYILHYIERKIGLQFKKTGAILIFGLCGITQFLCPFAPDFRGNIGERRQNHEG